MGIDQEANRYFIKGCIAGLRLKIEFIINYNNIDVKSGFLPNFNEERENLNVIVDNMEKEVEENTIDNEKLDVYIHSIKKLNDDILNKFKEHLDDVPNRINFLVNSKLS
jgi:hypothetical protein